MAYPQERDSNECARGVYGDGFKWESLTNDERVVALKTVAERDQIARDYIGCGAWTYPTFTGEKNGVPVTWRNLSEDERRSAAREHEKRDSATERRVVPPLVIRSTPETTTDPATDPARELVDAVQGYVARAVEPLYRRIEALEGDKLQSIERRVSRHADHLAAVESRLKKLQHGGE